LEEIPAKAAANETGGELTQMLSRGQRQIYDTYANTNLGAACVFLSYNVVPQTVSPTEAIFQRETVKKSSCRASAEIF